MWVATTQRHLEDEHGNYRDVLECSYTKYFGRRGISLVPVSNAHDDPERLFGIAGDGLLITGGDEVDPSLYGGKHREGYVVSEERDRTERRLLEEGLERGISVLGVCRGIQTINVYFGGGLEDVNGGKEAHPPNSHHEVEVTSERLIDELGYETATVNSYHDQAVTLDTLSSELEPFAIHDDRIVEGLHHPDYRLAAVQWHPERDDEKNIDRLLVESFEQASLFWERTDDP